MKLRRSCLSVPGNNIKMITKSAESAADCIVIDLEDSVPVSEKANTRGSIRDILVKTEFEQKEVAVRINSLGTEFAVHDILCVFEARPDAIVIPKVESARDIIFIDNMLASLEAEAAMEKKITIQALIETAKGVQYADEISRASNRLTALIFGIGDYLADTGAQFSSVNEEMMLLCLYPRSRIIVAAAAAGLDAIDSVYPNFKDEEGLKSDSCRGANMGFHGKWVIHPSQIGIVNESFTPSIDVLKKAKILVMAYEKAKAEGKGSIAINDRMVDEASLRIALKQCEIAKYVGLWDKIEE